MRGYSAFGSNATGTADKSALTVIATTAVRPTIFEIIVGNSAAPSDQAANLALARFTAAGTSAGSPPTPKPFDPADVAAIATCGHAHSVEPTYTAGESLLSISMNQRATFRWVAVPGYELKCPATASNGIGGKLETATTTSIYDFTIAWYE